MLKNIATAFSECTAKHESKASFNTNFIVPDLIDTFWRFLKRSESRLKKEILIFAKNIVLTKN